MDTNFANVGDMERLLQLDEQTNPQPWESKHYDICLTDSRCKTLLINDNGKIIGYSMFIFMPTYTHWVHFRVDKDYQHKAWVSKKLVDATVKIFRDLENKTPIHFEVAVDNILIQKYVEKYLGACINSTKKDYYGTGKDAYFMIIDDRVVSHANQ